MENNHITVLEIDLKGIAFNLNYFKSKLHKKTKVLVVLKAFGYGSSAIDIAAYLAPEVHYFAVAYLDEGITLRNAGIKNPILILHPQISNLKKAIEYNLEPTIYSVKLLKSIIEITKNHPNGKIPIHIKFNTGLNRLGFTKKELPEVLSLLKHQSKLVVTSVFSHIAASEDANEHAFSMQQIDAFKSLSGDFIQELDNTPFKHMLNTSGILNYANEAQFDMVRLGIGLFGFGNQENETKNLKNTLTLKSVISQIHVIQKGETVGYNRAFRASSTILIATIPIGHADGISRQLGNGAGYVYIKNQKAAIVGNVCMDMLMVNVTSINCEEGDEVIIYKNQEHINYLAKATHTIPYELLTVISQRVKRIIEK